MTEIHSFDAYGARFEIEPPFESGNYTIDTLGKFAVIAGLGFESAVPKVNALSAMADHTLKLMHDQNGIDSFDSFLTTTASQFGKQHTVTRR